MPYIPHYTSIVDLEDVSTKELVDLLFQARGEQKVAWLRTRLNQRLERRTGRRGLGGAKDRVVSNGSAKALISIHS